MSEVLVLSLVGCIHPNLNLGIPNMSFLQHQPDSTSQVLGVHLIELRLTQPARKENPTQNLTKQLQTDQELTSSTKTQRHTSQAVHPRQIPQETCTGQTGQEHRSDRCSLGSSG
jgi:hypothetical protein